MDQKLILASISSIGLIVLINHIRSFLTRKSNLRKYFSSKTVLITGASSGLGASLANELYPLGAKLILCARRVHELNEVKDKLIQKRLRDCREPEVLQLDVCASVLEIKEKLDFLVTKNGPIDILINNAGISFRGEACLTSEEVFERVMNVNYFGAIKMTNQVVKYMNESKDANQYSIVNIGSVQSLISIPYRSAYSASKHALLAYADALRAELPTNIHVLNVYPGYINTNISVNAIRDNGSLNGINDDDHARDSMAPEYVSRQIVNAIYDNKKDVFISVFMHRLAVWLRFFQPNFYHFLMKKRASKKSLNKYN